MGSSPRESRASTSVAVTVVRAVADAEEVDPLTLEPPLGRVVDASALDGLFDSTDESTRVHGSVSFRYAGHEVVVDADGTVTVDPDVD